MLSSEPLRIFAVATPSRTAARARNPRGQGERLREALIDAAIELLADLQDVEALSVRAVTARVGVTPTALYLHFADKDELLEAVKARCFQELRNYTLAAEQQAGPDPRAQLEQHILAYIQFAADLPGYYRVLFHTRRGGEPRTAGVPSNLEELEWSHTGTLAFGDLVRGVERCLPPGREPFPVALMIWAAEHGYVSLREISRLFRFPDPTTYVNQLLDAHLSA
jgi:AcrR family transcriptional regulator